MGAPEKISALVKRFRNNINAYKNTAYNETQVRIEFIDPFFEALGWDISNKRNYAEAFKEVIHEYSQKTKDTVEAPDYLFRIGGIRKFFVEAKKPSINLKDDPNPAYQLKRYAWSAKLPLSILTDFEEFIVYDCRFKPKLNDKPSAGRIFYFHFEEYADKWEEIASVFSRDAILTGAFDKFAESKKNKKGTAEVDDAFLSEIENWRDTLAKNIAIRNPFLSNRELNFAVQKTIDRIIFLRICEDRGIEDYGQLMNLLNGANIYSRLQQIYTRADEKYNSGLFYFEKDKGRASYPDTLTPRISIDDKVLKEIIKKLYYPESPYEFSVLPADILGHVYEQFLGKVIRLTPSHRAIVEEKPEVKKAGGVYYTPTYIVDYIVKNTLGKKLEEIESKGSLKSRIEQASTLRILDPACGSGSFLLGAYQFLLDWHLRLYTVNEKPAAIKGNPVYQSANGEWRLTTSERKRILLNNIYGVDIDSQAVEVTKLSLLLKVLEGETDETLSTQLRFFRERALPDLGNNIKCGNSLIGPDFYDQMEMNFLDDEEKFRINVFDWNEEFKEIMNNGGFDVVIGNPPYINLSNISIEQKNYFQKHSNIKETFVDIFDVFIMRSIELLNKNASFSFIIPSLFTKGMNFRNRRKYLIENHSLLIIRDYGDNVFTNVKMPTFVFVLSEKFSRNNKTIIEKKYGDLFKSKKVLQKEFIENDYLFDVKNEIVKKIDKHKPLKDFTDIRRGLEIGKDKKIKNTKGIPILFGEDISRYIIKNVSYIDKDIYNEFRKDDSIFNSEKILIRETGNRITAVLDKDKLIANRSLYSIRTTKINLYYLIGILNSNLIQYYYVEKYKSNTDIFPKIRIGQVNNIPIVLPNNDNSSIAKKIEIQVKNLTESYKSFYSSNTPDEKQNLQRQIEATDKQIDKLVYELYGLTEEEIKIVEEG